MKLFSKKLKDFLTTELGEEVQVHFLHCNAHFLLGLSSACEKALGEVDKDLKVETGNPLGRDKQPFYKSFSGSAEPAACRLIRTACDVLGPRGDQKNGFRAEWLTFCPESVIPSFKSNRFNAFFAAASALIFHEHKIKQFFSSGILPENINLKMRSVLYDIEDINIMCQICAVAIFHVKITLPYWKLVNSETKYTDFHGYVNMLLNVLETCITDPSVLLDENFFSVFDGQFQSPVDSFTVINSFVLSCGEHLSVVKKTLSLMSKESAIATKRQLSEFLGEGPFCFGVTEETISALAHCPLTNLIGESAFGDIDYDMQKRRNCSLQNRSAVHTTKRNKTASFIKGQSLAKRARLFSFGRQQAVKLRQQARRQEIDVQLHRKRIMVQNQELKINKEVRNITKNTELLANVKIHGGPCSNAEDVDFLCRRLGGKPLLLALKNEIRLQKLITKSTQLKLSGDVAHLSNILKIHFQGGINN